MGPKLSFSQHQHENMIQSDYKMDTKYYTAPLVICMPSEASDASSFSADHAQLHHNFAKALDGRVDAVVALHSDTESKEDSDRFLEYLSTATDAFDPGVMLYVVAEESKVAPSILDWCHENGFEIVSLKTEEEEEDDEEERFKEKTGAARVLEALESHMWTNMEYKTVLRPQSERTAPAEAAQDENGDLEDEDSLEGLPDEIKATFGNLLSFMSINPENASNSLKEDEEAHFGDLGEADLLSAAGPLQQLRSQLATLDDEKRRMVAAKVALMMMQSLGDDDEEDFM